MSIQNAMQAGVSGLSANANAVSKISENIANSGTNGYKRSFAEMVTTVAGDSKGVSTVTSQDVATSGSLVQTSNPTDLAIEGEGWFVVMIDPTSTESSNYLMTREGSFTADKDGFLKNAAGYTLAGYAYDDAGALTGVDRTAVDSLVAVNANAGQMVAEASTAASVSGNLPSSLTGTGVAQDPFVSSLSYYTALGEREGLTMSWTPSTATENAWTMEVAGNDGTVYGTVDVTFSDSGATPGAPLTYAGTPDAGLVAPAAFAVAADGTISLTIDNGTVPQTLDIALGAPGTYEGITQFDGDYEPQTIDVDGTMTAALETTEVDDAGNLVGVYANGERVSLYQIPVAQVDSPENMDPANGNAYRLTRLSGDAVLNESGTGGGTVQSGVLESSNVEIAEEMTNLIQVQRAYSSNAKIITTADEMLQEANGLKR